MTRRNESIEIVEGHMYVNALLDNMAVKRHILREELTQALGLAKDISYHRSRAFSRVHPG